MPLTVEIWSDVVCPWCYIGKRRFEAALAAFEARRWERCRMVVENSGRLADIEIHGGSREEHAAIMSESMRTLAEVI